MREESFLYFNSAEREGRAREFQFTTGSDYSGSLVEYSNYEALKETINELFPNTEGFVELYGAYGGYGIGIYTDMLEQSEVEWLEEMEDALENYPLISEETHSQIEYDILRDFYLDNIGFELSRYFRKRLDDEDVVDIEVQPAEWLFDEILSSGWAFTETGGVPFIDWERVFNLIDEEKLYALIEKESIYE